MQTGWQPLNTPRLSARDDPITLFVCISEPFCLALCKCYQAVGHCMHAYVMYNYAYMTFADVASYLA